MFLPISPPQGRLGVVVCTPGGGSSRRYFDLRVAGTVDSYSMARHLARAGFLVVTIDSAGVGDSDRPEDGYALTPDLVADVNAAALQSFVARLHDGSLTNQLAPQADLSLIGVGHSAGGLLTILQQARSRSFAALAVLGFHGSGLPDVLTDEMRIYAGNPNGLRLALPDLARSLFGDPLPISHGPPPEMLLHGDLSPTVIDALIDANSRLLALVGVATLIPGSIQDSLEAIDVPVFIGVGDHDITIRPHAIAEQFPTSADLTLFELHDAGHMHNVADSRTELWDRLAVWARTMTPAPGSAVAGERQEVEA